MLVTDDEAIADRARLMSLHGISRDAWNRYTAEWLWYYEIEDVGYKYNMTDLAAALGLVQLDRATELLEARLDLARAIHGAHRRVTGRRPDRASDRRVGWRRTPGTCTSSAWRSVGCGSIAAQVIEGLKELGIGTSVHFIPLHLHPYYRRQWGYRPEDCPVATAEYERVISLPIWPGMTGDDIDRSSAGSKPSSGRAVAR